jgi:chemotaxis protein CheZ
MSRVEPICNRRARLFMGIAKRKFRIESVNAFTSGQAGNVAGGPTEVVATGGHGVPDSVAEQRHQEMMNAIEKLGRTVAGSDDVDFAPVDAAPDALLDKYRDEIKEAAKLKHELDLMQAAIAKTKSEIVALRYDGASAERIRTVTDELDEVVAGTEGATETILGAAEVIDTNASALSASLSASDAGQALEIQEQVIAIFEACNFQDITGQRINKVVTALRFIEERIESMLKIWGESSFDGVEAADDGSGAVEKPLGEELANGPALPAASDQASQADIDALFD